MVSLGKLDYLSHPRILGQAIIAWQVTMYLVEYSNMVNNVAY